MPIKFNVFTREYDDLTMHGMDRSSSEEIIHCFLSRSFKSRFLKKTRFRLLR